MHTHAHGHTRTLAHPPQPSRVHTPASVHVHTYTCAHTHTNPYPHTRTGTHGHAHAHTGTHSHPNLEAPPPPFPPTVCEQPPLQSPRAPSCPHQCPNTPPEVGDQVEGLSLGTADQGAEPPSTVGTVPGSTGCLAASLAYVFQVHLLPQILTRKNVPRRGRCPLESKTTPRWKHLPPRVPLKVCQTDGDLSPCP